MNLNDKKVVLNWLADTSSKSIIESRDVAASRTEIDNFIEECVDLLQVAIEEDKL